MQRLTPKFDKSTGLLVAIIQDWQTKQVLMQAYMSKVAWQKTLKSGEVWFWSRSRKSLWHKGESSDNVMKVRGINLDCDRDCVLISVEILGNGNACHLKKVSCFFRQVI
jgi:phosphoribosyl-AMP cyclohydrolase